MQVDNFNYNSTSNNHNNNISHSRDYPVLIPYQVDCNTITAGKHIRQSKRHVSWRFGFAHIPSVLAGKTGVACRGIELDIHLIWSIASSKHILYVNDVIVHQDVAPSSHLLPSQRFEHSFIIPQDICGGVGAVSGGHVVHITAWALGIGSKAQFDQQFILTLDGQRYSRFYPIFALGSAQMRQHYARALARAENVLNGNGNGNGNGSVNGSAVGGIGVGGSLSSPGRSFSSRNAPSVGGIHNNHHHHERSPTLGSMNGNGNGSHASVPDIVGNRPRRKMMGAGEGTSTNNNYPHPYHSGQNSRYPHHDDHDHHQHHHGLYSSNHSTSSDPDFYATTGTRTGLGLSQNEVEEQEMRQVAQARLNSLKDLRRIQEQKESGMYAKNQTEEDRFTAAARIRSFRDMRYTQEQRYGHGHGHGQGHGHGHAHQFHADDDTIPTFARPPTTSSAPSPTNRRSRYANAAPPRTTPLQVLEEDMDLLDMDGPPSAVTIDTTIQPPDVDDDISTFSDVYSHLDPNQMWKTQQNISFTLQRPPVYTAAGDLIQPSSSSSVSHHPSFSSPPPQPPPPPPPMSTPQQAAAGMGMGMPYATTMGANTNMNTGNTSMPPYQNPTSVSPHTHHPMSSMPMGGPTAPGFGVGGFHAAPPPTLDSLHAAFAPQPAGVGVGVSATGSYNPQQQRQQYQR